jgi:hypothetical protein
MAKKQLPAVYRKMPTEQLQLIMDAIGTNPHHLVKRGPSKGFVKLSWIRLYDQLLDETIRRRQEAIEDTLNDFNYVGSRHHY